MNEVEIFEFTNKNQNSLRLNHLSANDYIAFRCCMLNGLLQQSIVLAAQAIEKQMKHILLLLDDKTDLRQYKDHKLLKLMNKIDKLSSLKLSENQELIQWLSDGYSYLRYPQFKDNIKVYSYAIKETDLERIDEFYFKLVDDSPLCSEIKLISGIYSILLMPNYNASYWARANNKTYDIRRDKILQEEKKLHSN